jgi:RNA polymerase sigma-70 factor, ECF subfamily
MLGFTQEKNDSRTRRFERLVLTHLDAAYNLARWLARDRQRAEDIVQDACLRALRSFDGFQGEDARPWLLTIVRNTFFSSLARHPGEELRAEIDEDAVSPWSDTDASAQDPAAVFARKADCERIDRALAKLPLEFREIVILRELEDLSYKEIAEIVAVPVGTVMSRLSRGRRLLARHLAPGGK